MAVAAGLTAAQWVETVREQTPEPVRPLVTQLAVASLPADTDEMLARYAASMVLALAELEVNRRISHLHGQLQRVGDSPDEAQSVLKQLVDAETHLKSIRLRKHGS